jgi:hypothetical protein
MKVLPNSNRENVRFWFVATIAILSAVALLFSPYALGEIHFYHDSIAHASVLGLFYDRLYSGDSILWSAALNGGQPLWLSLEITSIFDPVAFILYSLAVAFEWNWLTPYQVASFMWVFVFALGAAGCTKLLTDNRWSALLTFVILLLGPMFLAAPAASSGLILPFRYSSLVIYFYFRLRRKVTTPTLVLFTTTLAFSLASYQTIYPLLFYVSLVLVEILVGGRAYLSWIADVLALRRLWPWLIPALAILPDLVWLSYTQWTVAIPLHYGNWIAFFYPMEFLAWDAFLIYLQIIASGQHRMYWHGSLFVGLIALALFFLALRVNIMEGARALRTTADGTPETAPPRYQLVISCWLFVLIVLASGAFGLRDFVESERGLYGVRNLGFLLTGVAFLLAVMIGQGLAYLKDERHVVAGVAFDIAIFALCTWSASRWIGNEPLITTPLVVTIGLFLLVLLLIRVLNGRMPAEPFAALLTAVVLVEILSFSRIVMPSLERATAVLGPMKSKGIVSVPELTFGGGREELPVYRIYEFPALDYWPFYMSGPAMVRLPSGMTPAAIESPIEAGVYLHTHLFRLKTYDRILESGLDRNRLEQVLGVTRPILELVPQSAFADDPAGGLALVLRDGGSAAPHSEASSGEIRIAAFSGDHLAAEVVAPAESVLVYRDNMAPGWSVAVDGEDAELVVVDRINKAVAVPPGQHRVEFVYRPWPYLLAFSLRALVLLAALAACVWLAVRVRIRANAE